MIFNEAQIQEILSIIEFQHVVFAATNVGTDLLTEEDRRILRRYSISPDQLRVDYTPVDQAFYFGRLSVALRDQAGKVKYNDFLQYLRRGQYIPLSGAEHNALAYVKRNTYGYIKGLGEVVKNDVDRIIVEEDQRKRYEYEKLIQGSIERTIKERDSVKNIVLEIGNKTKDWKRNLGRIAETELQRAFETGRAEEIVQQHGEDALVYKDVFPGACRHCIRLYLTDGIGSQPKLFEVRELINNGTNIGVKVNDWVPTIDPLHPFCRCLLQHHDPDTEWSKEKKRWVEKQFVRKVQRKGKIRIMVNDTLYEV